MFSTGAQVPSTQVNARRVWWPALTSPWGRQKQGILKASWVARLANYGSSGFKGKVLPRNRSQESDAVTQHRPLTSTHLHMGIPHVFPPMHEHVYTHYTHRHYTERVGVGKKPPLPPSLPELLADELVLRSEAMEREPSDQRSGRPGRKISKPEHLTTLVRSLAITFVWEREPVRGLPSQAQP